MPDTVLSVFHTPNNQILSEKDRVCLSDRLCAFKLWLQCLLAFWFKISQLPCFLSLNFFMAKMMEDPYLTRSSSQRSTELRCTKGLGQHQAHYGLPKRQIFLLMYLYFRLITTEFCVTHWSKRGCEKAQLIIPRILRLVAFTVFCFMQNGYIDWWLKTG